MTDLLRRHLAHRLQGLFDRDHVVVWHDDSGALGPLLREVLPGGVEMPAFEGNVLSLRQAVDRDDPWLERKWLLYVPKLPDRVTCEWLAGPEADLAGSSGRHRERRLLRRAGRAGLAGAVDLWDRTNRQDWAACESVQRGLASRGQRQGPLAWGEDEVRLFMAMVAQGYLTGRVAPPPIIEGVPRPGV